MASTAELLLSYLEKRPRAEVEGLYVSACNTVAVFRLLPELSQLFVARLVFVDAAVPISLLRLWTRAQADAETVVKRLASLFIIESDSDGGVRLSADFQSNMRLAITRGLSSCVALTAADKVDRKHAKSADELAEYADERWDCVLRFLALPAESTADVGANARRVFTAAQLVSVDHGAVSITAAGFHFLLLDRATQVCTYLVRSLEQEPSSQLLAFLLQLSVCAVDVPYSSVDFSEQLHASLQHLREMGLVYMRKRRDGWFLVTPLVACLAGDARPERRDGGFVVVETNFRVCAYTASALQLAVLSTFTELVYRFPDMAVGVLTRESVRDALHKGITAAQMIAYLQSHAHPQTLARPPVIPPTVADQLRLWEVERDRFHFADAVLYSNFDSDDQFQQLRDFAQANGVLLWENSSKRFVAVNESAHDTIRQFWQKLKRGSQ